MRGREEKAEGLTWWRNNETMGTPGAGNKAESAGTGDGKKFKCGKEEDCLPARDAQFLRPREQANPPP